MNGQHEIERSGRIVATILWILVIAGFVVLLVLDVPGWSWLVYIGSWALGVGLVGLLRQDRTDVGVTVRSLPMVVVGVLFPHIDRLLRHDEELRAIGRRNAELLQYMATLLKHHRLGPPPSSLEQRCAEPKWYSTAVRIEVPTAALLVAEGLADPVRSELTATDPSAISDSICLLYWAEFPDVGAPAQIAQLFESRKQEIVPVLAALLARRDDLQQVRPIDDDELVDFLLKQATFDLDTVKGYATDELPGVARRMQQILESYTPTDKAVPWPTPDLTDLQAKVGGAAPALAAQIQEVAAYCSGLVSTSSPSAELLDFLYRRRFVPQTAITDWSKKGAAFRRELAEVLAGSKLLAGSRLEDPGSTAPTFADDVDCITRILDAQSEYSLAATRTVVTACDRHLHEARCLVDFLHCGGECKVEPAHILDTIETAPPSGLPSRASDLPWIRDVTVSRAVLVSEACRAIRSAHPHLTEPQCTTLSLVAVGEFVMRSNEVDLPRLSAVVARNASGGDTAHHLLNLLVDRARGHIAGSSLCDLLASLPGRAPSISTELVRRLDERLEVGEWPTVLPVVPAAPPVTDTRDQPVSIDEDVVGELQQLRADIGAVRASVDEIPSADALLRLRDRLAGQVPWPTTEFDPLYLVTFGSRHGPLGALIDVLTPHDTPHDEHHRRRLREIANQRTSTGPSSAEIRCLDEVLERVDAGYYQFAHYTSHARAGVMKAGVSFDVFAQTLFDDLSCLITLTDQMPDFTDETGGTRIEWEDIEVNLLSLGFPIRYDLWREGVPGLRQKGSLEHPKELAGIVGAQALEPLTTHRPH